MPIWRKLHVKTTDSLDVNDMPDDFTRLMWVLMPLKLCREGRGIDMPEWIKSQLFPLRSDISLEQVESAMCWYQERRMIARYKAQGRPYFRIKSWHKYQGKTTREADSPYPAPKEEDIDKDIDVDIDASRKTYSRVSHGLVTTKEEKLKLIPLAVHVGGDCREEFEEVWERYQYYKAESGEPLAKTSANSLFAKFYQWGPVSSMEALETAMYKTWKGPVEPKGQSPNGQQEPAGFAPGREILKEIHNVNT